MGSTAIAVDLMPVILIMIEHKLIRWDPFEHPGSDRCTVTHKDQQCPYCVVEGSKYCHRHNANHDLKKQERESLKNYRLTKWRHRISELANSPEVKSLREEIGIMRMMLEEMLEGCTDRVELLLYSSRISDLVMKVEKLVVSCDKLENRMGLLLDKQSILFLATQYIEIIHNHIEDAEVLESINEEIVRATSYIGTTTNG